MEKTTNVNVKGIILLAGIILGTLTAWIATGSFLGTTAGLVGGFIIAVFFITVILPHKPHDR